MDSSKRAGSIVVCCGFALASVDVHAQCESYSVEIIHGPPCQFVDSGAGLTGINEAGEASAWYYDCNDHGHPAIWLGQGPLITVPLSSGALALGLSGINSSRQMSGTILTVLNPAVKSAAFVDYSNGILTNLGIPPDGNFSEGTGINESGVICGTWGNSATGNPALHGFVWKDGQMTTLELPMGPDHVANGIADDGSVCGWMGLAPFLGAHGFIWKNGEVIDIGTVFRGSLGAELRGINNLGAACGYSWFDDPEFVYTRHGFFWQNGKATEILPVAPFHSTRPLAMNDSNVVVGECGEYLNSSFSLNRAFVWQNGVTRLLNDVVSPGLLLDIRNALGINNSGQIAGHAILLDGSHDLVAVRLTPVPSQPGDFNCDHIVDADDLFGVINHWGLAAPNPADFDHDGIVDAPDLFVVIENWSK